MPRLPDSVKSAALEAALQVGGSYLFRENTERVTVEVIRAIEDHPDMDMNPNNTPERPNETRRNIFEENEPDG